MLTTLSVILTPYAPYLAGAAYALLEYWLGRTDKVKAGSTIELALRTSAAALSMLKKGPPAPKE